MKGETDLGCLIAKFIGRESDRRLLERIGCLLEHNVSSALLPLAPSPMVSARLELTAANSVPAFSWELLRVPERRRVGEPEGLTDIVEVPCSVLALSTRSSVRDCIPRF